MGKRKAFNGARRQVLRLFGLGLAGATVGTMTASDRVFAKQFATDAHSARFPDMSYDPELQMMVDPITRQPIHSEKKVATIDATITACPGAPSAPDCTPHCDDYCG